MSVIAKIVETMGPREAGFEELLKDAPIALACLENPGKIRAFNAAFEQLPGFHPSDKLAVTDLLPPEHQVEMQRLISEMFRGDRDGFQIESRTGGPVLEWSMWPIRAKQEGTEGSVFDGGRSLRSRDGRAAASPGREAGDGRATGALTTLLRST